MSRTSAFANQFDEPAFRKGILGAMLMGMPEDVDQQLTWIWDRDLTYTPDDPAGHPYDWTDIPVTDTPGNPDATVLAQPGQPQTLIVPYALEFGVGPASATTLGEIDISRATVTVLDVDHDRIQTADYARVGDTRYRIKFDEAPTGLFGVTVWVILLEALDET